MALVGRFLSFSVSIAIGIISGVVVAEQCCVEYRPRLGWLIGILGGVVSWSMIYTVSSESSCPCSGLKTCDI